MTDNLNSLEIQKISKESTTTKDEHTFNPRMTNQKERFTYKASILNTWRLGFIRLYVCNSLINTTERS